MGLKRRSLFRKAQLLPFGVSTERSLGVECSVRGSRMAIWTYSLPHAKTRFLSITDDAWMYKKISTFAGPRFNTLPASSDYETTGFC